MLTSFMVVLSVLRCPGSPLQFMNEPVEFVRREIFFLTPILFLVFRYCLGLPPRTRDGALFAWTFCGISTVLALAHGLWFDGMLSGDGLEKHIETITSKQGERINVYSTNYLGATGGYELLYRQESIIAPGVKCVNWSSSVPPPN